MTEFWESELGAITGKPEDAFAKTFTFTLIPDGTMAVAKICSFCRADDFGKEILKVEWLLMDGDFKGQKVRQKIKVWGEMGREDSDKIRHRALNMLKLIYQTWDIKPKHSNAPTDNDLEVFVGKTAGIKIKEYESKEGKIYNFVAEIHEAKGFKCETGNGLALKDKGAVKALYTNHDAIDSAFSRNREATASTAMDGDIPF